MGISPPARGGTVVRCTNFDLLQTARNCAFMVHQTDQERAYGVRRLLGCRARTSQQRLTMRIGAARDGLTIREDSTQRRQRTTLRSISRLMLSHLFLTTSKALWGSSEVASLIQRSGTTVLSPPAAPESRDPPTRRVARLDETLTYRLVWPPRSNGRHVEHGIALNAAGGPSRVRSHRQEPGRGLCCSAPAL
jgi:hypothetical protein